MTVAPPAVAPAEETSRVPAWKERGTRKPMAWWDRIKFLLLIVGLFGVLVWNEYLRIEPLGGWGDAFAEILNSQQWLPVLAGLEVLRQVHFGVSEISPRYHRFWQDKVFGRSNRFAERRFSAWTGSGCAGSCSSSSGSRCSPWCSAR